MASSPPADAHPPAAPFADSERVGGRPVACQFASTCPADPSAGGTARKLLVDRVPARTSTDDVRRFFSEFGEIEAGSLVADHATGQFCGYATLLYKSPEGLAKALEEPRKVFDGCEFHCSLQARAEADQEEVCHRRS